MSCSRFSVQTRNTTLVLLVLALTTNAHEPSDIGEDYRFTARHVSSLNMTGSYESGDGFNSNVNKRFDVGPVFPALLPTLCTSTLASDNKCGASGKCCPNSELMCLKNEFSGFPGCCPNGAETLCNLSCCAKGVPCKNGQCIVPALPPPSQGGPAPVSAPPTSQEQATGNFAVRERSVDVSICMIAALGSVSLRLLSSYWGL